MSENLTDKAKKLIAWIKENKARTALVAVFILSALVALNLDFQYIDGTQWVFCNCGWGMWLGNALINVGPELAGIVIGVVTIDYLNERRQDEQLKEQLILQIGSNKNDIAVMASVELRARGWLEDGSLEGADLSRAELNGANLGGANLGKANLKGADLRGAKNWTTSQLQEAETLEGAIMPDGTQLSDSFTFEMWAAMQAAAAEEEE